MRIHAVGCSLIDYLYTDVSFVSPEIARLLSRSAGDGGLVPGLLVFASEFERFTGRKTDELLREILGEPDAVNLGGPAIVALIHAAQLTAGSGVTARFFGEIGEDATGDTVLDIVGRTPVAVDDYRRTTGVSPYTYVLSDPRYDRGRGERMFINNIGAAWNTTYDSIPDAFYDAEIVVFGGTALVPRIHEDLGLMLRRARDNGAITVVTTVYDFLNQNAHPEKPWPLGDDSAYSLIDVLIADREEAVRISGTNSAPDAVEFFIDNGVGAVIVTQGADPSLAAAARRPFARLKPTWYPVSERVCEDLAKGVCRGGDTTGCGDNFAGGVIGSLAEQAVHGKTPDLAEAVAWGTVSGGYACYYAGGTLLESRPGEKMEAVMRLFQDYALQASGDRT
ncbi:MAG: carbohydrate kinase family protein [Spirochaetaceae bacterium]|nr:MAG: carbohydrate kinase family protein [Spirochaetaceae bacterium]